CTTPKQVAETVRHLCKRHVLRLTHMGADQDAEGLWLDHVYRLFYYDATPYDGVSHHPVLSRRIEFNKSEVASFRRELFLSCVINASSLCDWAMSPRKANGNFHRV